MLLGPPLALVANVRIYLPLTLYLLRVPFTGHLQETAPKRTLAWGDIFNTFRKLRTTVQSSPW
jgi:hypothetical protein